MKKMILFFIGYLLFNSIAAAQNPRIEIHHIGAGDGDATLIIAIDTVDAKDIFGKYNLDTAVILIDGQRSSTGKEVWRYVKDTVNALSPTLRKIDCIILTHLHIDHFGGLGAVINEAIKEGWKIGRVIDRQYARTTNYYQPENITDDCYGLLAPTPDKSNFNKYVQVLKKQNLLPTTALVPGNDLFAALFNFKYLAMICVVSNGITLANNPLVADTCFLPLVNKRYKPRSENDLSIGFLLTFQGFKYLTLGDLGGVSGSYTDGETPVTKWLMQTLGKGYHICANKVSHHGSEESSSPWFAATNNFTVSVIPASLRSFGKSALALPTEVAIKSFKSAGNDSLLYTYIPKNPKIPSSYWTKGDLDLYNDVVLKVSGVPGFGQNVNMTIVQHAKSKKGVYTMSPVVSVITCNKGHDDD